MSDKVTLGINYLRALSNGAKHEHLMNDLNITREHINECIREARKHKDRADRIYEVTLVEPDIKIWTEKETGKRQAIESISVELEKPLTIHYSEDKESSYKFYTPVIVTIKRP